MIIKLPSRPLLHFIPHPSWGGVVGILASFDDIISLSFINCQPLFNFIYKLCKWIEATIPHAPPNTKNMLSTVSAFGASLYWYTWHTPTPIDVRNDIQGCLSLTNWDCNPNKQTIINDDANRITTFSLMLIFVSILQQSIFVGKTVT